MPSGPAPRKNNTGVIIGLVILVVVLISCSGLVGFGAYRANHSGIVVNGVELTRKEVKTAEEEVKMMMMSVNPDDLAALKTDIVASNPLSQLVKDFLVEQKTIQIDLDSVIDDIDADGILGAQLGSEAGRKKSRDEATKLDAAIIKFYDRKKVSMKNYQKNWGNAFHLNTSFGADTIARFQKTEDAYKAVSKIRIELIEFASKCRPESDGAQLLFRTDPDIAQYNKLADRYDSQNIAFQKANDELGRVGATQFNNALSNLK